MALGPEVKVRGFFMRLIRAVADLRPRCIAIALSLIRIMGCAIRPGQDMWVFAATATSAGASGLGSVSGIPFMRRTSRRTLCGAWNNVAVSEPNSNR